MNDLIKLIESIEPYYEKKDDDRFDSYTKNCNIEKRCKELWEALSETEKEELFNTISSEGMFNLRRYVAPNYKINLEDK